jgi:hypothetical protein
MAGKSGSRSKNDPNSTGKAGNASGSTTREARGDTHGRASRSQQPPAGKHPPAKIFTAPQSERKRQQRVRTRAKRQSERGDYGR